MKVSFLTPSISRALGGIYEIERNLAQALVESTPVSVRVVGLQDEFAEADRPAWSPLRPEVLPVRGPSAFGYSPGLVDTLVDVEADLVHLHALWMYTSVATLQWKQRTGRPHMVTTHGMLDPWALEHSRWKKRIAGWLYENKNLREADCVQVNSEAERRAVRDYGIDAPVCIIPNGVTLPDDEPGLDPPWKEQIPEDRRVLLFLGRIHPKKGLSELLNAWDQLAQDGSQEVSEWSLAIVGWDDGGHEARLQRMAEEAGLDDVNFLGPMFGDDKEAAFHHADAFILPSHSEGLPMAVLEAWSYRLPVLMTPACNLPVGFNKGAAVQVEPAPTSISDGIHTLCAQSETDRNEMGWRGRTLVEERFTWTQVAQQMAKVYRWVLGEGDPPSTVVFD